jgi:hypothetical protein
VRLPVAKIYPGNNLTSVAYLAGRAEFPEPIRTARGSAFHAHGFCPDRAEQRRGVTVTTSMARRVKPLAPVGVRGGEEIEKAARASRPRRSVTARSACSAASTP